MPEVAGATAESRRAAELLQVVLPSDVELAAFCQDHFPAVRARFTDQMARAEQVRLLLDAIPPQELITHLREFAPNAPAWGPQRRTWPYVLVAVTLLIALIGGFLAWRMTMGRRVVEVSPPGRPEAWTRAVRSSPARGLPIRELRRRA